MISIKQGTVTKIIKILEDRTDVVVNIDGKEEKAINYNKLTGKIQEGDKVILNTTAVQLNLGTGGYHFIIHNLNHKSIEINDVGHIMKLRYTPFQLKVLAAEEQQSIYHHVFHQFTSLHNMPVIVGTLHSMLAPIAATLKYLDSCLRITYIMTDGAALPIYFSNTVNILKEKGIINTTITIGNAFGGDLECVNIYNGLIAAKEIAKADIAIVTMGPGIVGTGTQYGFTGIEQGMILDAVNDLDGLPIAVPRISFQDQRERHFGISHHSLTVLHKITKTRTYLVIPELEGDQKKFIDQQIKDLKLDGKHNKVVVSGNLLDKVLQHYDLSVQTMGRNLEDDRTFFLTCSAAANYGYFLLKNTLNNVEG